MAEFSTSNGQELSDLVLIQRVCSGDNEAFQLLSRRYSGLIITVAKKYYAVGLDRNDFFQEGLMGLLSACKCYSEDRDISFRNYAALCINRRFSSIVKRDKNKGAIPADSVVPIDELEISDNNARNPETLVLQKEQDEDFWHFLKSSLSPLELDVLKLYLEGNSYEYIAQKLSVSQKSVDNALQRIRRKIASR